MQYEKLSDFAKTFPVLRDYAPSDFFDRIDDRDFKSVKEWLYLDEGSMYWAVVFVFSCWNTKLPEDLGLLKFDLHAAIASWDHQQRRAFADWAKDPFYF